MVRNRKKLDRQQTALAMENFTMGVPLHKIAKSMGRSRTLITKAINDNYFNKQRSYNTITLVMDSKINYNGKPTGNKSIQS